MIMFPFTATATVLDTVDVAATPLVIGTMPTGVGIPKALWFSKPAGVAYTVGAGARINIVDENDNILFSFAAEGVLDSTSAVKRLITAPDCEAYAAATGEVTLVANGSIAKAVGSPDVDFRAYFELYPF